MEIKPVKTSRDHQQALKRIETLWAAKSGTADGNELDVLSTLVHVYEEEHFPVFPPDPIAAIQFRMEQSGLRRTDLSSCMGGRNRVSEVMKRKRSLTVKMMRNLHRKLKIPAEVLLG